MRGIFIEADDPKFLENQIDTGQELVDLNALNVTDMLAAARERDSRYDTAPFDPDGKHLRFYPGGFTVWSGFPGTGKSTLLRQFICRLLYTGRTVFVASLEEDPQDVFIRLACVAHGVPPGALSADNLQWCVDCWHDKLRLWSYRRGVADHARILAIIAVLAAQGARHAVIDSLARLDVHSGDWEAQRLFGNALEATAAKSGSHIHLVAHPRKLISAQQEPDINDIAGSADIGRLADNVLFVRRPESDTVAAEFSQMRVSIRKQRYHTGACRNIDGFFNLRLRQWKPDMHDVHATRYLPDGAYGEMLYPERNKS